ncbi:hypothetical protein HNR12_005209 [Streptomonospora nanhaiensis]|uniref:Uncharacterized protein n=1 Tax=Streptomonospora nanhaiensis TaxID=1323731 RepID=A0A853BXP1_9ACTN|nr:hypothetical protein [Streptomonospora nanhaiensis]
MPAEGSRPRGLPPHGGRRSARLTPGRGPEPGPVARRTRQVRPSASLSSQCRPGHVRHVSQRAAHGLQRARNGADRGTRGGALAHRVARYPQAGAGAGAGVGMGVGRCEGAGGRARAGWGDGTGWARGGGGGGRGPQKRARRGARRRCDGGESVEKWRRRGRRGGQGTGLRWGGACAAGALPVGRVRWGNRPGFRRMADSTCSARTVTRPRVARCALRRWACDPASGPRAAPGRVPTRTAPRVAGSQRAFGRRNRPGQARSRASTTVCR